MPLRNHKRSSSSDGSNDMPRLESSADSSVCAMESAPTLGEKAESATKALGAGMLATGKSIREHEPSKGVFHEAGELLASKLESGGMYLNERGLQGVTDDVADLIRHNPMPALLVGLGLGMLLARIVRR